jgi:putative membrane protein
MPSKRIALTAATAAVGLLLVPATAASAAPSDQDSTYLKAAHQSNLTEIAGGKIAQQKATSQQVKDLAARFISDHTKLDAALTKTAATLNVTLPDAPNAEQQALAARYQATSGKQFDTLFISTQMTAHMKAMALGRTEISDGSDAQAKKAATDAAPVVASHHTALESAARDLGVPDSINTGTGGLAAHRTVRSSAIALIALGMTLVAGAVLVLRRRRSTVG